MSTSNPANPAPVTLSPDGSLRVVCHACTSGSLVIGEEHAFAELPVARARSVTAHSFVFEGVRGVPFVGDPGDLHLCVAGQCATPIGTRMQGESQSYTKQPA